jgi:hypothetical protein
VHACPYPASRVGAERNDTRFARRGMGHSIVVARKRAAPTSAAFEKVDVHRSPHSVAVDLYVEGLPDNSFRAVGRDR